MDEELLERVAGVCRRVKELLTSYEEDREPDKLDCLVFNVDRLYRLLLALNVSNDVKECVGAGLNLLEELNRSVCDDHFGYSPRTVPRNNSGRPRLDIRQEQLEYLLNLGFKCPKIAEVLGVSLSTIRRRMSEFGLSVTALYSSITDHELDVMVSQIKREFPNSGSRLMHGHLLSRGHRVPHARVR